MTTDLVPQPLNELAESEWDALERRAARISKVGYIPDNYRGKPDDIMAAGLALATVGIALTPVSLSYVYVVKGRVDFMYRIIADRVHAHGCELWVEEESDESATVCGQRPGSSRVHRVTYTMADAVTAGLVERNPTYKSHPRDMLVARAGKRCANRICPEAMMSLPPSMRFVQEPGARPRLVAEDTGEILDDDEITDAELVEDDEPKIAEVSSPSADAGRQEADCNPPAAVPPLSPSEEIHARLRALPNEARTLAWEEWRKASLPPPPGALDDAQLDLAEAIVAEGEHSAQTA